LIFFSFADHFEAIIFDIIPAEMSSAIHFNRLLYSVKKDNERSPRFAYSITFPTDKFSILESLPKHSTSVS